jgi:peptidoglycan glycosyltransferase
MSLIRLSNILAGISAFALIFAGLLIRDRLSSTQWLLLLLCAWLLLLIATRIELPEDMPQFNRSIVRTSIGIATVFVVLSAQLARLQGTNADAISRRTGVSPNGEYLGNARLAGDTLTIDRGEIFDRNGSLIAGTERDGDRYRRYYPDLATASVAGYYSPLIYGTGGLESSWNDELTGRAGNEPVERVLNSLLHRPQTGADLFLTLDAGLQNTATDLLGGRTGAVVVMDVETGAVIVLASAPVYDPNQLFTTGEADRDAAQAYWSTLLEDPATPLVSRATLGLFTPGSTFKTVTAAIGIEQGDITPDEIFIDDGSIEIDGRVLVENNRPDDSKDEWTVAEGLAFSLNVVFAQIGLAIEGDDLWNGAEGIGFAAAIPFDLPVSLSQIANDEDFLDDPNALADTAFGQGELLVTPLLMCMITATYAHGGEMMRPYLVERVVDEGSTTRSIEPRVWRRPISVDTANQVADMMVGAVTFGTVTGAQVPGYSVGGKTGTAEIGDGTVHSWFIGFIGGRLAALRDRGDPGRRQWGTIERGIDRSRHARDDDLGCPVTDTPGASRGPVFLCGQAVKFGRFHGEIAQNLVK